MRRISIFLFLIVLASCKSSHLDVERVSLNPQILHEGLYTMLPGAMLLCDNFLVWEDGFATDTFMHVVDLRTNQEVGTMGKIGRGAEEFITPNLLGSFGKYIVVADDNLPKCALYSIDSLLERKNPYIPRPNFPFKGISYATVVDPATIIVVQFDNSIPFRIIRNQQVVDEFGHFPIQDSISNRFDVLQGGVEYNHQRDIMLYTTNRFPYMALYKKNKGGSYTLLKESAYPIRYAIKNKRAQPIDEDEESFSTSVFTKDYIVSLKQDEDNPLPKQAPTSGIRDLSGVPHTVYIFDYNLNLLKIADLNMPVLNITANPENNTLYIIGLKDSYCIAKCEIE